jgi:hypothetical protein
MFLFATVTVATRRSPDRRAIVAALLVKLLACFTFCALTIPVFKGGDMLGYHDHGIVYAELIRGDLANGTNDYLTHTPFFLPLGTNVARCRSLSGLAHFLVFDSYLGASALFALIGFSGQLLIYRTFVAALPDPRLRRWWQAGILFTPSLTFWSASLMKEPLGIWGLGCALSGAQRLFGMGRPGGLLRFALGVYALALFRAQVVPVFLLAMAPLLLGSPMVASWTVRSSPLVRAALSVALVGLAVGVLSWITRIDQRMTINDVGSTLITERTKYSLTQGGSTILNPQEDLRQAVTSPLALILLWPEAMVFTLLRPFPWEGLASPLILAAALENTVLLALTVRALAQVVRRPHIVRRALRSPMFAIALTFVSLFAFAVGLSTPNLGTVSRYRIPVIPFFVALLTILEACDREARGWAWMPLAPPPDLWPTVAVVTPEAEPRSS